MTEEFRKQLVVVLKKDVAFLKRRLEEGNTPEKEADLTKALDTVWDTLSFVTFY